MTDIFSYVGASATVSLVGLCWAMFKKSNNKNCIHDFVKREDCHQAMDGINTRIEDLDKHLTNRLEDIKDLINNKR